MLKKEEIDIFLDKERRKKYFMKLSYFLEKEYKNKKIYPNKIDIFKALEVTNFENLKLVIIGQDPYHTKDVADGLAFSSKINKIPPSLKNIFKEVKNSYPNFKVTRNPSLEDWSKQGILLWNMVLTVEESKPGSHYDKGWEQFSINFLNFLIEKEEKIIFLLLGNKAQKLKNIIDLKSQIILEYSHPSPFSYSKSFKNSKVFKKINILLKNMKKEEINW
ncbi:uracil-DNA glycosylase [Mesomycoplasma molare]|uniref:Uracil-DNA glycosylase n=1 Tax=Mesomycoplasma molare TaxID=171288 RepID=A0ABY5TT91_9BACT|nr:uracil-DNA glycosylase [Mesomycoplasma molare]UWD33887.1 uracil-DNA glycosylase [Mesomycoplasma molare]